MSNDKEQATVADLPLSSSNSSSSEDNDRPRQESLREASDNAGPIGLAITAFWKSEKTRLDPEAVATQRSVFENPELASYYQPHQDYENIHRFDTKFRWTWGEELPLIRRLDCMSADHLTR